MRCAFSLVVALLVVAGCASSGDGQGDEDAVPDPPEGLASSDEAGPIRLRLALTEPGSFRPDEVVLSDQGAVIVADLLYAGLTEIDGSGESLRPGLATEWSADDEFRRWTFRLDPDSGVDAATVVASLEPLTWSATADAQTRGHPMAALTAGMETVIAVDPSTVVIELDRSNAGLPWVLSGLPFSVIGPAGATTGPFEVMSRRDGGLTLRRRADSAPDAGSGGATRVDEVELIWADSGREAYRLLVDRVADGAVVDLASVGEAEARDGFVGPPTIAVQYYVLNPDSPELVDIDRREAVMAEIDRQHLVGDGNRALAGSDGLVSPSVAGYRPRACGTGCGLDGAGDSRGDAEAWAAPGLALNFTGEDQRAMAEALAGELEASGIPVVEAEVAPRELAQAIVSGTTDVFAFGWLAPAGSVDAILPPLLGARSPANVARVGSSEIEGLLADAARTADDETRWELLDRAHRLALAQAQILPVSVSTSTLVVAPEAARPAVRADGSIDLETMN